VSNHSEVKAGNQKRIAFYCPRASISIDIPRLDSYCPAAAKQIEQQLGERMKQEVARIDARLIANAGSPGATANESPVGHAQPRLRVDSRGPRADSRRRDAGL
jgi:hypothetical protein